MKSKHKQRYELRGSEENSFSMHHIHTCSCNHLMKPQRLYLVILYENTMMSTFWILKNAHMSTQILWGDEMSQRSSSRVPSPLVNSPGIILSLHQCLLQRCVTPPLTVLARPWLSLSSSPSLLKKWILSGKLWQRNMLILPLLHGFWIMWASPLWVTLCIPESPFARNGSSPFWTRVSVKKQYKFEWICLAVDYLHIYLTEDVLIIFHRLTYLRATFNEIN